MFGNYPLSSLSYLQGLDDSGDTLRGECIDTAEKIRKILPQYHLITQNNKESSLSLIQDFLKLFSTFLQYKETETTNQYLNAFLGTTVYFIDLSFLKRLESQDKASYIQIITLIKVISIVWEKRLGWAVESKINYYQHILNFAMTPESISTFEKNIQNFGLLLEREKKSEWKECKELIESFLNELHTIKSINCIEQTLINLLILLWKDFYISIKRKVAFQVEQEVLRQMQQYGYFNPLYLDMTELHVIQPSSQKAPKKNLSKTRPRTRQGSKYGLFSSKIEAIIEQEEEKEHTLKEIAKDLSLSIASLQAYISLYNKKLKKRMITLRTKAGKLLIIKH